MSVVVRRVVGVLVALAVCASGVSLAVIALPLASYEQRPIDTDAADASAVAVTTREIDLAAPATVAAVWSADRRVRLPAVSGLVSSVSVSPGVELGCAQEVLRVSGRALLAYCGPGPLFRDVSSRTNGADASEFVAFMQRVGLLEQGEVTRQQVDRAIRNVQAWMKWPVTGAVTPQDFVWIGEPFIPSDVLVEPGVIVAAGADVLQIAPVVESATVAVGSGARAGDAATSGFVFALDSSSTTYAVGTDGTIDDLSGLAAELRERLVDGELPASAVGTVRLEKPLSALTVPATAVLSGPSGECVRVSGAGGDRAVPVSVLGSSVGVVYVDGAITDGDQVVVAPDGPPGC
jgi:hypothetical protein